MYKSLSNNFKPDEKALQFASSLGIILLQNKL